MKRGAFLKALVAAPAALMAYPQGVSGAMLVSATGESIPWKGGEIRADTRLCYLVERVVAPWGGEDLQGVVWCRPATDEVGIYRALRLASAGAVEVEDGDGWDAVATHTTPFAVHFRNGDTVYSREAWASGFRLPPEPTKPTPSTTGNITVEPNGRTAGELAEEVTRRMRRMSRVTRGP